MSQMHNSNHSVPREGDEDDLEQILLQGLPQETASMDSHPASRVADNDDTEDDDDDENVEVPLNSDVQGALGLFAEATQDMATATVELGIGRHFACVDFCNQAVEKAAQAVSLLRTGRRSMYDHDLRALGKLVGAPENIQDEMALLTPFHPEAFYADTPPEEADEVIDAAQASAYIQSARKVLRWAKSLVLNV